MGVPTFYTRLLDHPGLTRGRLRQHAPVRFRLGAAARRDPRRLARADRLRHPRALRHDRDQHDHVEPLRGRAPGRDRRLPAARASACASPSRRAARRWRRARSASSRSRARTSFSGYWRMPEKTAQEFRPDGFFITGDLGLDRRRRLHPHRRPRQGPRHLRRLQRLSEGGRGRDRRDRRRARKRGDRRSASRFRRGGDGGRRSRARARRSTEAAILAALGGRLAKFKAPKRVFVVESLPRNAMGKVQKAALREAYKDIYRG